MNKISKQKFKSLKKKIKRRKRRQQLINGITSKLASVYILKKVSQKIIKCCILAYLSTLLLRKIPTMPETQTHTKIVPKVIHHQSRELKRTRHRITTLEELLKIKQDRIVKLTILLNKRINRIKHLESTLKHLTTELDKLKIVNNSRKKEITQLLTLLEEQRLEFENIKEQLKFLNSNFKTRKNVDLALFIINQLVQKMKL